MIRRKSFWVYLLATYYMGAIAWEQRHSFWVAPLAILTLAMVLGIFRLPMIYAKRDREKAERELWAMVRKAAEDDPEAFTERARQIKEIIRKAETDAENQGVTWHDPDKPDQG